VSPEVCPTHLVPDAPASEDAFGAHQRIAGAIAQLVETSNGGKCIGLLGTWGAGKSTVVQLLQNQLERHVSHVVWIFDAWAHEGDSLRRTFLESLIERLTGKGWLKDQAWNERLEYLAGRRKVTEQASRPRLSPLAIVLAVSLLFVPIGGSLFDNRLGAGLSFRLDQPDWSAIAGLLLAFAPLLVLVVYVGALLVKRRSPQQVRESLRDALTVFVRQTDTSQRTETLDSGEPTTLEFERAFFDVMAAALTPPAGEGADGIRRLVIVVDNLDRVNTEQALAVWSTLQTFVRHRDTREPWLDHLWCVLPFDGDAIRRLWPPDGAQGVNVAESFLDKTFQVRFEVPLPLLSDWKDYIIARLKDAMPAHSDDDFFKIYRLYAVRRARGMPAPTPRELKLFVNQVGSLHRQWQDEIPLADLAYYALLQRDKVPIASESIALFPLPGEVGLVSDSVRKHLAAMAYGVPIKSAEEVLLREPIIHALETADPPALQKLADGNEAFALVFEQALWRGCEEWPPAEAGKLLHAVVALEGSEICKGVSPSRVKQWFDQIEFAARRAGIWAPMDRPAVDGMLALHQRVPSLGSTLFQAFVTASATASLWGSRTAISQFVQDYIRLNDGLSVERQPVLVPDNPAFCRLSAELMSQDPEARLWDRFQPPSIDQLINELSEHAFAFDTDAVAAVRVLTRVSPASDWTPLVNSADMRLKSKDGRDLHLLTALHALWSHASWLLSAWVESDLLLRWMLTARKDGAHEVVAAWLYTVARCQLHLGRVFSASLANDVAAEGEALKAALITADSELCQQIASATLQLGPVDPIFDVAEHSPELRRTMATVLVHLAALSPPVRVFAPSTLIERWNRAFLGEDPHYVASVLAQYQPGVADALATRSFQPAEPALYAGVADSTPTELPAAFVHMCVQVLQSAAAHQWDVCPGREISAWGGCWKVSRAAASA
jgi:hypothetical protein